MTPQLKLTVSGSPHLKDKAKTSYIMRDVIIGLLPAVGAAIYFFGILAAILILNCVVTALLTEWIINRIRKQKNTIYDFSAAVTGILVALILPPSIAWYGATIGVVFAILVGKHLFGGLGSNIFNPALLGRAFLAAAYPRMLTTYTKPGQFDTITEATPLMLQKFSHKLTSLDKLFLGNVSGSLGETSAICLLVGGLYLLLRKSAGWRIPVSLLISLTLVATAGYLINPILGTPVFHLLAGGLLLGTFFMATDPATTPVTAKGRFIFGATCGILIMVIRYFSNLPEGVMYSILFCNALVPLINRYTKPKAFGRKERE
ncbi:MAG: RnfABCDGE type electron transport complex subunit D [Candidatus Omnitrophica bacterium]|nr:RnfABCDGE type electron transport complex subunit D [Candidatus Omnitrophota bacterium]MCF7877451.1 RnfABCDGE type electron transport complex subunit D [Candidatus Omnitrophota bacterium]MCF7878046.1 RnfABCDGE type electron transport complex subunit D [Candidatus Omnitrophota bacterium]MCF7892727.1 RnfABCDGE type electron transport complex subunit D [Candidatus Omnitrophota bacterium]